MSGAPDVNDLHRANKLSDPMKGKPINGKRPKRDPEPPPLDGDDPELGELIELPTIGGLLESAIARADARRREEERPVPVLGADYSKAIGRGRWPGAHFIVSGTGAGKSQFELQNGLLAARANVPVVYIGLELSALQIALRAIGEETRLPWSAFYIGDVSARQIERAREAIPALAGLPFHCVFGQANDWPISKLDAVLRAARSKYQAGPLSVTLDFLQLVSPTDRAGASDIRQHIGDAAYRVHTLAQRYDASISVVSSSARNNYAALSGDIADAGFSLARPDPLKPPEKRIASPERFVGMSKESGSTEFAAESVTALVRWPGRLVTGEAIVLAVAAKVRCRWPSWAAYTFEKGRFEPYPVTSMDDLPDMPKRKGGKAPVPTSERERRVLEAVKANPNLRSVTQLAQAVGGKTGPTRAAINAMLESGRLKFGDTGIEAVGSVANVRPTNESGRVDA